MNRVPQILGATFFGDPVLRAVAKNLTFEEIKSENIQNLVDDIKFTIDEKKMGVGLAAPQVGISLAIARIAIRPTPNRPTEKVFERVIINPEIIETIGEESAMWEGCLSFGFGDTLPYAQVPRYKEARVKYYDERGEVIEEYLEGLSAHVFQHEVDHLNGVLFVDRVTDNKSFITIGEYIKRVLPNIKKDLPADTK